MRTIKPGHTGKATIRNDRAGRWVRAEVRAVTLDGVRVVVSAEGTTREEAQGAALDAAEPWVKARRLDHADGRPVGHNGVVQVDA